MMPDRAINIDDFKPLGKLVSGYELDPAKSYLIVCDGKSFNKGLAESLMRDIRQMHPDIHIAIVASLKPKDIEVKVKADDANESVRGSAEEKTDH